MSTQPEPVAPKSPARSPRPHAEYRWTPAKVYAFFDALACHGKVAAAARSVGMTRQSAYKLKDRIPVVAQQWALAQAMGRNRRLAGGKATPGPGQGDTSGEAR